MEFPILKQFFFLAINPKKARYILMGNQFKYGVLGAILMDLKETGIVRIDNKRVYYQGITESVPEFCTRPVKLLESKPQIRIYSFFNRLGFREYSIRKLILKYLAERKQIQMVQKKFLIFYYTRYVPYNPEERVELVKHLRDILLRGEQVSKNDLPILYLLKSCSMVRSLSDIRKERVYIRRKLRAILKKYEELEPDSGLRAINKAMRTAIHSNNSAAAG